MKLNLLIISLFLILSSYGQTGESVLFFDYNNVRSSIGSRGCLFWDGVAASTFEIPKNSGVGTIFSAGLWIGAKDENNNTHTSSTLYNTDGYDYFSGPLKASGYEKGTTESPMVSQFNQLYKVYKSQISSHIELVGTTGYNTPNSILNWPGNGNAAFGYEYQLAPYFDNDENGSYNPETGGDYPLIKGDFAIWGVMNDNYEAHGESEGRSFGFEIQYMLYGYTCNQANLNNSIFLDYKIINRSDTTYYDTYLGFFSDFDIGNGSDDYVGCNVELDAYYGYNADEEDALYTNTPPAQAVVFLNNSKITDEEKQLSRFVYLNNNSGNMGTPQNTYQYYNYLNGYWKDNRPVVFGGYAYSPTGASNARPKTKYVFPGTSDPNYLGTQGVIPTDELDGNWTEHSENNEFGDRRGLGSSGPFTISPNESVEFEIALVWARGETDSWSSVEELFTSIETIKNLYNNNELENCHLSDLIKENKVDEKLMVYPNPSSDFINIKTKSNAYTYSISSINGLVQKKGQSDTQIDISDLENGMYIVKIESHNKVIVKRFIKVGLN